MDKKTRDALAAKFPEHLVKTRPGNFGNKSLQYIEASQIIARFSDVCEGDWSFTIISSQLTEDGEVIVHGRLEALGVTKDAFGRASSASKNGEVIRSLGDCYKSAATQALTVAARYFGVAAYLYSDDHTDQTDEPQLLVPNSSSPQRASAKQVAAIWAIGRKLGMDANTIRQRCLNGHGAFPEQLDKGNASAFIQELDTEIQRGAA